MVRTAATAITIMVDGPGDRALYRLLAWLSPSYPVGAFAYSHGLEWAVEDGRITDEATLQSWIKDIVAVGAGWSDAVLFAQAFDAAGDAVQLAAVNDLAVALAPSKERQLETTAQGNAFLKTTLDAWPWEGGRETAQLLSPDVAYPVAVAISAAGHGIAKADSLHTYLHAVAANLVSAGVRLIPLGQTSGQRIIAALEEVVASCAVKALNAGIERVGGIAMLSDIAAMKHETQYTRLFRS